MDNYLNFNDIIKKSVLKLDVFSKVSILDIILCLFITFLVGMFIFFIYKKTFQGVVYSHSYNISLVAISLITSLIILTISSNVVLSLGMVGALSIVRFRTAVKDPMDIIFMFWAISIGITNGAGFYPISIIGSLFIGLVLIILSKQRFTSTTFLLIIHHRQDSVDEVEAKLNGFKYKLKSKTVKKGNVELTIEIKLKDGNTDFVDEISSVDGVEDAVLLNYNGDYAS